MDIVFKALADPTRRQLLDRLRVQDGQTVTELTQATDLSRFAVMKHLGILEDAALIASVKTGRFKYHYLNALTLQELVDRWVEPFIVSPLARSVLHIKSKAEAKEPEMPEKPDFLMETYIEANPETVWDALTSKEISARYNVLAGGIEGTFETGSSYRHVLQDGSSILWGEILTAVAPSRLEMTFVPGWDGPNAQASRVCYELEAVGKLTKLRVAHYGIPEGQEGVRDGWAKILSNLKSLLETGHTLDFTMETAA